MRNLLALAFAVALLLLALFLNFESEPQSPLARGVGEVESENETPTVQAELVEKIEETESRAREELDSTSGREAVGPRVLSLVIRCLRRDDGVARGVDGALFQFGYRVAESHQRVVLFEGLCTNGGVYRADHEVPELPAGSQLFVCNLLPEYHRKTVFTDLPGDDDQVEITYTLEAGCSMWGSVYNSQGEPEPNVRVILRPEEIPPGLHPSGWYSMSDEAGRFELHHDGVSRGAIRARKDGVGNALLEDVEFSESCQLEKEYKLVLAGSGVLAGRVVDPDGNPFPSILVEVRHAAYKNAGATNETAHLGKGIVANMVRTDEQGSFRFEGLEPGAYRFLTMGPSKQFDHIANELFETDQEDLNVTLFLRRMEITLLHANNQAPKRLSWFQFNDLDTYPAIRWERKRNYDLNPRWSESRPNWTNGNIATFFVERDWTVRYCGVSEFAKTAYEELVIGSDDWLIERTIVMPEAVEPGILTVRAMRDSRKSPRVLKVEVHDEQGVLFQRMELNDGFDADAAMVSVSATLPPGSYNLVVKPIGGAHFATVRSKATVTSGTYTELDLDLLRGSPIEFSVTAEALPRDHRLRSAYEETSNWKSAALIWPNEVGATVRNLTTGHLQTFNHPHHSTTPDWIVIGGIAELECAYPPGDHTFEFRYPGFAPTIVTATTKLGETTRVDVELIAE